MVTDALQRRIEEAARGLGRLTRWTAWLRGAWWLLLAAGVMVLADLLYPLPAGVRRMAAAAWFVGCLVVAVQGPSLAVAARRRSAEFYAVLLERGRQASDNALVNAVQFSHVLATTGGAAATSLPLMKAEIDLGRRGAESIVAARCIDRRSMMRHGIILSIVVVALAATAMAWPDVWTAVLPRFTDPGGDHPPFCPVKFAVHYETSSPGAPVYYGDSPKVVVELSGRDLPERAWLEVQRPGGPEHVDLFRRERATWFVRFDNVRDNLRFRVHVPEGYSKLQELRLVPVPRITDAVARYEPPAYTRRPAYEEPIDKRGIRGLRGTVVTLTLGSNRPLQGGDIRLTRVAGDPARPDGSETLRQSTAGFASEATSAKQAAASNAVLSLPMRPLVDALHKARAAFPLERDGHLAATVTGADGLQSRDRVEADVHVIEDAMPTIAIEEPGRDAYVVAGTSMPVAIHAEDDIGIAAVRLHWSVNGIGRKSIDVPMQPAGGANVYGRHAFEPRSLGLTAGDVIEYYATATDNCPAPPHRADSPVYRLAVIGLAEYADFLRRQAGMEWLRERYGPLMDELAEIQKQAGEELTMVEPLMAEIPGSPAASTLSDKVRQQMNALAEKDRAMRERAAELARRMDELAAQQELYDVQKHLNEQLRQLSKGLTAAARRKGASELSALAKKPDATNGQADDAIRRVAKDLFDDNRNIGGSRADETARRIREPLETLEEVYELTALTEEFKSLAKAQRDLATRVERFGELSDLTGQEQADLRRYAAVQQELSREVNEVRRQFAEKGKQVEEFAEQLEQQARYSAATQPADTEMARVNSPAARAQRLRTFGQKAGQLAEQMQALKIVEDMDAAAARLDALEAAAGYRLADSAAGKMASMVKKCQAAGGEGSSCLALDIVDYGDSLRQLMQSLNRNTPSLGSGEGGEGRGAGGFSIMSGDAAVYGPMAPIASGGPERPKSPRENLRFVTPEDAAQAPGVETIVPDQPVMIDVGPVRGETVPARYKRLTEEYFRRIAEENR